MLNPSKNQNVTELRLKKAQEDNDALLHQLMKTQEELEHHLQAVGIDVGTAADARSGIVGDKGWQDDELPEILAENLRLQALVELQQRIHQVQSQNALNAKLGDILIQGIDAPRSLVSVPGRLVKIWRQSSRRNPPDTLGGNSFDKVIAEYDAGGFAAVEKLIAGVSVAPTMLASAYTALARQLMKRDRPNAAEAARRAYSLDPKPYRLKWLTFRLHEAGDLIEAEAMLGILPTETQFSDSEARQALQLQTEAKLARQREARRLTAFAERRAAFERQLNNAISDRDRQSQLLSERSRQVERLELARAQLEQDQVALVERYEAQSALLDESERKIDALQQANDRLEVEKKSFAALRARLERQLSGHERASVWKDREIRLLLENVCQLQEELEQQFDRQASLQLAHAQLSREKRDLMIELDSRSKAANEHGKAIDALKERNALLEREKLAWAVEREKQSKAVEELGREIDALKQGKAQVERERQALVIEQEVQSMIAEQRARDVAALKQVAAQLEQKHQALAIEYEVQSRVAVQHARTIDELTQAKARLEQEKQDLVVEFQFQSKTVVEREREVTTLADANAQLERDKRMLEAALQTQSKIAEDRGQEIETLKQARVRLEKEKQTLAADREARSKVADERGREIEMLTQAKRRLEQEAAALKKSPAILRAANKGDADIDDLIGDLELFFNGKAIIYADVGAYVGDVFLKIRQTAKKFRIHEAHLFEPNPASYAQLLEKTTGKGGPIVHTYNVAVGDSNDARQYIQARSMTKALPDNLPAVDSSNDVFTARHVSLDSHRSIFTDGRINLLKIDVEGRELDVLNSARQMLATQSVDILYIEVGFNQSGTQQTYFVEIDKFLQPLGYRVMRIYEQKEEWMSDSPLLRRANIAYMSERFANAHPLKLMRELRDLKDQLNELQLAGSSIKNVAMGLVT